MRHTRKTKPPAGLDPQRAAANKFKVLDVNIIPNRQTVASLGFGAINAAADFVGAPPLQQAEYVCEAHTQGDLRVDGFEETINIDFQPGWLGIEAYRCELIRNWFRQHVESHSLPIASVELQVDGRVFQLPSGGVFPFSPELGRALANAHQIHVAALLDDGLRYISVGSKNVARVRSMFR